MTQHGGMRTNLNLASPTGKPSFVSFRCNPNALAALIAIPRFKNAPFRLEQASIYKLISINA
jgi:hypothetical protein